MGRTAVFQAARKSSNLFGGAGDMKCGRPHISPKYLNVTLRTGLTFVSFPSAHAIVAQLVARNLAKVEVTGSNPVYRSGSSCSSPTTGEIWTALRFVIREGSLPGLTQIHEQGSRFQRRAALYKLLSPAHGRRGGPLVVAHLRGGGATGISKTPERSLDVLRHEVKSLHQTWCDCAHGAVGSKVVGCQPSRALPC